MATAIIYCPNCGKEIEAEYAYHKGCPERGEQGFSLGQPAEPAEVEWDFERRCTACGETDFETVLQAAETKILEEIAELKYGDC